MTDKIVEFLGPPEPEDTSAYFIAPESDRPGSFTAHGGRPFWWRDRSGVSHACEGAQGQPGQILYRTMCLQDVPGREVYHPRPQDRLTCDACLSVIRYRQAESSTLRKKAPPSIH